MSPSPDAVVAIVIRADPPSIFLATLNLSCEMFVPAEVIGCDSPPNTVLTMRPS